MKNKKSGIYFIRNKVNHHLYIGSSNDINKRFMTHKRDLFKQIHHNPILQRSYNKYGLNNFIFEIFIECDSDELLFLEQFCLDFLMPLYNISKNSIAPMTGRKHKKETLLKFKKRKVLKGKNHYNYGKKASLETRKKQSLSRLGTKRSIKTRLKMSKTAKRIKAIDRIDRTKFRKKIIDSMGIIHESLTNAAKFWNISRQAVCDNLKNRSNWSKPGVKFFYV